MDFMAIVEMLRQLNRERRQEMSTAKKRSQMQLSVTFDSAFGKDDLDLNRLIDKLLIPPRFENVADVSPVRHLLSSLAKACFRELLPKVQIEALCTIVVKVVNEDALIWQRTGEQSFQHFQKELIALSANRPPYAVALFTPAESYIACDAVLNLYYAYFRLYKTLLSTIPTPALRQRSTADIDEPQPPLPLCNAVLVQEHSNSKKEIELDR
jgi:hypothetical protein